MKKTTFGLLAAAACLAAGTSQAALEPLASYDKFDTAPLDAGHWQQGERRRAKKGLALNHLHRDFGPVGSSTGGVGTNFSTSLSDGSRVTQLKATITVLSASVSQCAENTTYTSNVLARVIGSLFNTGTPTAGNQTGDVLAQAYLQRSVSDPTGPLTVTGGVLMCTNSDCSQVASVGSFSGLGTAAIGQPVNLAIQWDRATKTVTAIRDGVTTASVGYLVSDTNQPAVQFKQVSTRTNLANCPLAATRSVGAIEASFDNVSVNKSGAP